LDHLEDAVAPSNENGRIFAHEGGSLLDMMGAAEEAPTADLEKKSFRQALGEFRHSRLTQNGKASRVERSSSPRMGHA
jgi:hypothetical protein